MKVLEPRILTGLLACLIAMQAAQAQNDPPAAAPEGTATVPAPVASAPLINDAPGQATASNFFGYTEVNQAFDPLIRVDSRGGSLYGQGGFTAVRAFLPYWGDNNNSLLFADIGGFGSYNPGGGANIGVGGRQYFEEFDRILGLNAWYDFDAGNVRSYHQLGFGFESLGRYIDYRANGYIPISSNSNILNSSLGTTPFFISNFIAFSRYNATETAFGGFDAEMGGPVPFAGRYGLNGYVGTYFFHGPQVGNFTGVSARLQGYVNESVTVGAQVTHDHLFDTNAQVQVTVTLPDGTPGRWLRQPRVRDRLTAQVMRNYRVVVREEIITAPELAINPQDNQPFFVVHVNPNLAPGTGTGTFENPYSQISQFNNLATAQKSGIDIIYVSPRTDGTSTQLNTGVTLLSNQHLLSNSVTHTFTATQGTFQLPGFVPLQALPVLSNTPGANVVTFAPFANNVEVSGFKLNATFPGSGIVGFGNSGVNINRNVIDGAYGIQLTNLSGTTAIGQASPIDTGSLLGQASIIESNSILNNTLDGINIFNTATAPLDVAIVNNIITGNGGHGIDVEAHTASVIDTAIVGNTVATNGGDGIHIVVDGASNVTGLIDSNTTLATATTGGNDGNGLGIYLDGAGSSVDFYSPVFGRAISNNVFDFNGADGIHIESTNGASVAARIITNTFGDSTITGSGNSGYGVNYIADSGIGVMQIGGPTAAEGNSFFSNGLGGIYYALSGTNVTTSLIQNNTFINGIGLPAGLILPGFDQNQGPNIDDTDVGPTPVGFNGSFFGVAFSQLFVNENGTVSIGSAYPEDTPQPITNVVPTGFGNAPAFFAPFFADMDQGFGANHVTFGTGIVSGHAAFGVNYPDVSHDFFSSDPVNKNNLQMVLVDRSDTGAGNFDIIYNYKSITWDTGETSGGNAQGLYAGPLPVPTAPLPLFESPARVGYSNGVDHSLQLPGSGVPNAFLDSGPAATSLSQNSFNSNVQGRYVFEVRNNAVALGNADAIHVETSGTAQLNNSNISNNTITGVPGYGINVHSTNTSQVNNLIINANTLTSNDGGIRLQNIDSAHIDATVTNNSVTGAKSSGLEFFTSSTDGMTITSATNTSTFNALNGIDIENTSAAATMTFTSNGDTANNNTLSGLNLFGSNASISNITATDFTANSNKQQGVNVNAIDTATINFTMSSFTATGNSQNGLNIVANDNSVVTMNMDSAGAALTTITGNLNGINAVSNGFTFLTLNVIDADINSNINDGVNLARNGSSLLLASLTDSNVNMNAFNGIQFYTTGADPSDPNQPNSPDPNRLTLLGVSANNNGTVGSTLHGIGLDVSTSSDSMLIVDATTTTFDSNVNDGVRVFSTDASNFGNPITNERSVFDNVSMSHNGGMGLRLFAMGNNANLPNMLIDVNSNTGSTLITDNVADGVHATVPYGSIDLQIEGTTLAAGGNQTLIQRNAANGISFNVANLAQDNTDNAIYAEKFPSTGNVNLTSVASPYSATGFLNLSNVIIGDNDPINGAANANGGDGVHLFDSRTIDFATKATSIAGTASFLFLDSPAGLLNTTIDSSIISNNLGDGIDLYSRGNTDSLSTGNLVGLTVTNSEISYNQGSGVTILLNGKNGDDIITTNINTAINGGTYTRTLLDQFTFDNNLISNNKVYGVYYESNAGAMTRRDFVQTTAPSRTISGSPFWGTTFQDATVNPGPNTVYDPNAIGNTGHWQFFNGGRNSTDVILSDYLSLATDINSNLSFTNNRVLFNGVTGTNTGDGVFLRVGTDSYLAADIGGAAGAGTGNTFSGNANSDFHIGSFTAYAVGDATRTPLTPPASASGNPFDHIFLDDTAQMDLRFNNNTGRKLDALYLTTGFLGAAYNNADSLKGTPPFTRPTQVFEVDDGLNLNANNNWGAQDIQTELNSNGNVHLRTVADPFFPNPAFPQNYGASPLDPFLP